MDASAIFKLVTGLISGLALFLYGMDVMSSMLTTVAGGRLSGFIEKITGNRYAGWLFGTSIAVLVQSSATSVMTVGLVNSGIMKLTQAVSVLIGANLGTTATAWLLSLNSLGGSFWLQLLKPSSVTPFLALGGIIVLMFEKSDRRRSVATIAVGFSIMMIGMNLMSDAVAPLQDVPAFKQMMLRFSNPVIGVGVGLLTTLLVQSSAAAIGILQALSMSVGITYAAVIPIVCGAQISTCLTAILASLSSSNSGKRTALTHLFYNVIRNAAFLVPFYILHAAVHFPFLEKEAGAVGIAAFHTLINLAGCAVFLPLSDRLVKLVERALPFSEKEQQEQADTLTILNPLFLSNPAFAIDQAAAATGMLADAVQGYFSAYLRALPGHDGAQKERARMLAERSARYAEQLRRYMIRIQEKHMRDADADRLTMLQGIANDYAQIAVKITGMQRSIDAFRAKGGRFSKEAWHDINLFGKAAQEILDVTTHEYGTQNERLAGTIQVYREIITDIHGKISKRHVRRLHAGICAAQNNVSFTELCAGYELIIDRCDSIAGHILLHSKKDVPQLSPEQYEMVSSLFGDKYSILDED